jgi:hypothetical protein
VQSGIPAPPVEALLKGCLVVAPDEQLTKDRFLDRPWCDGTFGTWWFAERVWEFDYPKNSVSVLSDWSPSATDRPARLGFRSGPDGKRELNFPRIAVSIDGESFEMLLDTGATAELTQTSAPVFGLEPGDLVGISYITRSSLERWVVRHPEWKVLDGAEGITGHALPMIEVPEVVIAGIAAGPVWFAQRPDPVFRESMSEMMDRQIEGAIGGSALKYYRFILDYPGSAAYFARPASDDLPSR